MLIIEFRLRDHIFTACCPNPTCYPLETEKDLQASISIMDKVRVDDVQVYEYHPEPGTVGGNIRPQLPPSVRRQRVEILRKHYIKRKLIGNVRYLAQAPFGRFNL